MQLSRCFSFDNASGSWVFFSSTVFAANEFFFSTGFVAKIGNEFFFFAGSVAKMYFAILAIFESTIIDFSLYYYYYLFS